MGWFPYTASKLSDADRGYLVLQFYMVIIAYTQQVSGIEELFGTLAIVL